jgi:hypothetical protein
MIDTLGNFKIGEKPRNILRHDWRVPQVQVLASFSFGKALIRTARLVLAALPPHTAESLRLSVAALIDTCGEAQLRRYVTCDA